MLLLWGALMSCAATARGAAPAGMSDAGSESSYLTIPLAVPGDGLGDTALARLAREAMRRWEVLRDAVVVGKGVWLVWNVGAFALGPVRESGSQVVGSARYQVRPEIVFTEPKAKREEKAPAPLRLKSEPGMSMLFVSSVFPLKVAELLLANYMAGQRFEFTRGYVSRVSKVRLVARGDDVMLCITLDGEIPGVVEITGRLRYSQEDEQLYLGSPTVAYQGPTVLPPRAIMALRERLSSGPFWKLSTDLGYTAQKIEETLSQGLGEGFEVRLSSVRLQDVTVNGDAFTIEGRTSGHVTRR
ncbi:DUF4403 family protein [Myxococcus stipitatus]|uniref:DUF4403 family protein n=1 Tax=Myxococcus stipitatus TaxID=83455 RepID=UPI0030CD9C7F